MKQSMLILNIHIFAHIGYFSYIFLKLLTDFGQFGNVPFSWFWWIVGFWNLHKVHWTMVLIGILLKYVVGLAHIGLRLTGPILLLSKFQLEYRKSWSREGQIEWGQHWRSHIGSNILLTHVSCMWIDLPVASGCQQDEPSSPLTTTSRW